MASRRYKNITIHPAQGGALIGSASDDVPTTQEANFLSSSANYTTKTNFRRETDGELRREGWELFNPHPSEAEIGQWGNIKTFDALDSQYPIRAVHQFPGTNGTPVLIAIAGGTVWRLRASSGPYSESYVDNEYVMGLGEDFYWQSIYIFRDHMDNLEVDGTLKSPFEGGAYRWEVVNVTNHVIINNGVDLPIVYKSEWDSAEPVYGLRENGVVSVGTIASFQDRLFCSDLTVIEKGYVNWFTSGVVEDPYGNIYESPLYPAQVSTQRYQYRMVYSSEGDPKLFNAGIVSGDAVVMESGGLPGTLTINNDGSYEVAFSYRFKVGTKGSMYKLYNDGLFQSDEAYTLNISSPIPMIKFVDEKTSNISSIFLTPNTTTDSLTYAVKTGSNNFEPYSVDYGSDGTYGTYDDSASDYWTTWTTYKLVDNNGDDLGVADPDTGLLLDEGTYSIVLRPYVEQLRSPAAFREFSQDGSRMLAMKPLADKLVCYRDSVFFFLSRTNNAEFPFAVEPRYSGGRVADFRHTIIDIDGKQHLFMGNSGIYSINRSSTEPKQVALFEIGPNFWSKVPPDLAEYVYAVDNPITREIFINSPIGYDTEGKITWGAVAYDYINHTLSEIDCSFTACAYIRKPKHNRIGPEEAWFVMGVHQASAGQPSYPGTQVRTDAKYGGVLTRYGYGPPPVNSTEPYRVYSRLGEGYESTIKSGLIDFGDSFSDKEIRSYVLELSSKYGTTAVRVKISTTTAPQGTESVETMQVVDGVEIDYVELNNLVDENMIPMYIKAPYIRDQITVLPEYDSDGKVVSNPIKLVGRTFEVSGVNTRATTQAYNQG